MSLINDKEYIIVNYIIWWLRMKKSLEERYGLIQEEYELLKEVIKMSKVRQIESNVLLGTKNEDSVIAITNRLSQENKELKKVIEILKEELSISFEDTTQEGNGYWVVLKNWSGEEEVFIHSNTADNYELLKGVLGND